MKHFLMFLLLFPLTFDVSEKDSSNSGGEKGKSSEFVKIVGGIGMGRYITCSDYVDYQEIGISATKYESTGFTYGGNFNFIRQGSSHRVERNVLAAGVNVGYYHKYFEVRGGLGYPSLLVAMLRLGPEYLNVNAQIGNSTPYLSGQGIFSLGLGITKYFEVGASGSLPSGYYCSATIPFSEENSFRFTVHYNPEWRGEYSFSFAFVHFDF